MRLGLGLGLGSRVSACLPLDLIVPFGFSENYTQFFAYLLAINLSPCIIKFVVLKLCAIDDNRRQLQLQLRLFPASAPTPVMFLM